MTYCWASDYPQKTISKEVSCTAPTIVDWCNLHGELGEEWLERNPIQIGGIENMWMRAKRKIRCQFSTSDALFPSYLHKFIWRQTIINGKYFEQCLNMIHVIYPV